MLTGSLISSAINLIWILTWTRAAVAAGEAKEGQEGTATNEESDVGGEEEDSSRRAAVGEQLFVTECFTPLEKDSSLINIWLLSKEETWKDSNYL